MAETTSVMVVDDDEGIREGIREVLEDEGHAVFVASNGLEALRLLQEGARPSVILLDLMMPLMNGWQFVEEQRRDADLARIPVLVISADGNLREKATAVGAAGYLHKPFRAEGLINALASVRSNEVPRPGPA